MTTKTPSATPVATPGAAQPAPAAPAAAGADARAQHLNLPTARHAQRVPAHITKADLARIRQGAHALPQLVKPGDYLPDHSPGFEQHLDTLGLVLLHKAVAGQRPSRWIHPALMDTALAHLDAIGPVPNARPLMLERTAALEAMGIARHAGAWSRLIRQPLNLSEPGWQVPVLFRLPIDDAPVWAFYRDADAASLMAALGPVTGYPHAHALMSHLEQLLAQARAAHPRHLAGLLPRLQAECAAPQALAGAATLADLLAACSRAYERWAHQSAEQDTLQGLTHELAFQGYPATFQKARRLDRQITLYVGPPNSGKTHAAFDRLAGACATGRGAYLAPLRLLALEGRDRLAGAWCAVFVVDRRRKRARARRRTGVISSTIEMVGTQTRPGRRGRDRRSADDLRPLARLGLDPGHRGRVPAQRGASSSAASYAVPAIDQPAGPVRRKPCEVQRLRTASSRCSCWPTTVAPERR